MNDFVSFNRESWLAEQQRRLKEELWEKELLEAMQASCITAVPVRVTEKRRISSGMEDGAEAPESLPLSSPSPAISTYRQRQHRSRSLALVSLKSEGVASVHQTISPWLAVSPSNSRRPFTQLVGDTQLEDGPLLLTVERVALEALNLGAE